MRAAAVCILILAVANVTRAADLTRFGFEQRYFMQPGKKAADFSIVFDGGLFHLFYTVGNQGESWPDPGNMVDFGHATSSDFVDWVVHDRVLGIEPPGWSERNLWAPHALPNPDGGYLLYYTGVDSSVVQQTGLASSDDLFGWTTSPANPVYHPDTTWADWAMGQWSNCRDPFVLRYQNTFALLSTASTKPGYQGLPDTRGAVSLAFSPDGQSWTDTGTPMFVNDTFRVLESTFLLKRQGTWYLFYTEQAVAGEQYMTSPEPFARWDKLTAQVFETEGFAAEIFEHQNQWYYLRIRDGIWADEPILGVKIDRLSWNGPTPVIGPQNAMLDDWTILWGDAFDLQPTFGDRPADRTGVPSNVDGFFWINTAEQHAGPIAWGCPECPPDDRFTGVLRSRTFELQASHLALRVGGGNDPDSLHVTLFLAADDTPIDTATGDDSDRMRTVVWDLASFEQEDVYIEIADLRTQGPFGHINVDAIVETNDPPGTGVGDPGGGPESVRSRLTVAPVSPARPPMRFLIDTPEQAAPVRLLLHNVLGRTLRVIELGRLGSGRHVISWDGRTQTGAPVPPGIYLYRVEGAGSASGKVLLIR